MRLSRIFLPLVSLFLTNGKANATSPELMVPGFIQEIKVVEGNIFMPAFNMDMTMNWPEDLHTYHSILSGNDRTIIIVKRNSRLLRLSLSEALQKKYVDVFSISTTAYGRNPGLIIEPLLGTTLVSLKTGGLILADSMINRQYENSEKIFSMAEGGYDLNTMHGPTYSLNQQNIWIFLNNEILNDKEKMNAFVNDVAKYKIVGSGRFPPYYNLTVQGQVINIHIKSVPFEPARPSATYYNEKGQSYYMLQSMIDDLKQLIVYKQKDSFLVTAFFSVLNQRLDSIIVIGRYKGIAPIQFHFTSEQKIMLTGRFLEDQGIKKQNQTYKASLSLDYDFDDSPESCSIPFPDIIQYSPSVTKSADLQACGLSIKTSLSDIHIGL